MPVALSIPDTLADRLRHRAAEHDRTVDEEALAILEADLIEQRPLSIRELHEEVQAMGLHTASDSVAIIREARDGRGR